MKDSSPVREPTGGVAPSTTRLRLPPADDFTGNLSEVAKSYVDSARADLERATWAGAGGEEVAVGFSDAVDELVRFIVETATIRFAHRYARAHQRCAVIAQGGYGRREMNPWSDVDLLILYPGRVSPYVETISERLIQTLFDAQLQVGWAVRTTRDCVDQAAADLTVRTSMLDGRFVTGSEELGKEFAELVRTQLAVRDAAGFVERKMAESSDRQSRMGGSVFMLEPNVKEGQGGLRDLHTLQWISRVKRGASAIDGLAAAELASESEQREMLRAREYLLRVRNALHFLARFKHDRLSFDYQERIAERFGYEATPTHSPGEVFMREYYTHAAIVARTTSDLLARLTAPPNPTGILSRLAGRKLRKGVSIAGSQLVVDEKIFEEDPVNLLAIFHDAQKTAVTLSSGAREVVRRNAERLTVDIADSERAIDVFMSILKSNDGVYRTLGEMNRLGVLGRLIPEFGRLFCMVQHDFYHVYTVDEHSLIGIRELERVREGAYEKDSPLLTQVMRECDRPELLFLSMMFHDLGKGYGGDHDERGALMVVDIAKRLGLNVDDSESLEFLVRNHLMMSALAQTRDIEDDELVEAFVADVQTPSNLKNLYLLTFADMRAVGPQIWNGWRDHLLSELYLRAIDVFETGEVSEANREARVQRVRDRVVLVARGDDEIHRLQAFLIDMPAAYLLSSTDERIIDDWRLYESLGAGIFRSGVAHFRERGFSELAICTHDSEGLFVRLCGVLTAHGLNILSAKIVTSANGIVIDTFRVDHVEQGGPAVDPLDPEVWAGVRTDIERMLADEVDVAALVEDAARRRPATSSVRKARKRARTDVQIDNTISRQYTVLDVYASDRPGILFGVADAIYRLGLTIHLAKINTYVNQVLDVFYVTDAEGRKVAEGVGLARVRDAILERIREPGEDAPLIAARAAAR
jgi:[protein-PII] uridylyltransferase